MSKSKPIIVWIEKEKKPRIKGRPDTRPMYSRYADFIGLDESDREACRQSAQLRDWVKKNHSKSFVPDFMLAHCGLITGNEVEQEHRVLNPIFSE